MVTIELHQVALIEASLYSLGSHFVRQSSYAPDPLGAGGGFPEEGLLEARFWVDLANSESREPDSPGIDIPKAFSICLLQESPSRDLT